MKPHHALAFFAAVFIAAMIVLAAYRGIDFLAERAATRATWQHRGVIGGDVKWIGNAIIAIDGRPTVMNDVKVGVRADGLMVWEPIIKPRNVH